VSDAWTIRAALEWTQGYLATNGEENPRLAAQWLLAAATGLTRLELYTNYDLPLSAPQRTSLREGIKRRVAGEPLQYILGKAPFRRLELTVRPGALIPRPETEVLVEIVLAALQEGAEAAVAQARAGAVAGAVDEVAVVPAAGETGAPVVAAAQARVLDLCTGTGCIALALLQECPGIHVVATDIDPAAVELARENASEQGWDGDGRLVILQDDLASSLLASAGMQASFDVVVSNPPYIPTAELEVLPKEVAAYEPRQALDGGFDGLDLFRRILEQAQKLLKPGGLLACELHETRLDEAKALCEAQGFRNPRIHPDLTGTPRHITAQHRA
jgi:release factor glutamine methyltransferase